MNSGRIERTRTDRSEKFCPIDLVCPPDSDIYSSTFVSDCLAFNVKRQIETLKCTTELVCKSTKDSAEQLDALKSLATLLVEDTRLGDHLDSGVLSYLVEFLEGKKDPAFQFYSALALETIVSKKGKEFKDRSVPYLLNLILSPEGFVKSTALDTLTEIANVFPESCDTMIDNGALKHLESLITYKWNHFEVLKSGCQLLTAFCRTKPHLLSDKMDIVVNTISTAIESEHESVLIQGCLALSLLSDRRLVKIATGVDRLLYLIDELELQIVFSALRTIGNYVRWGNDEEIQSMITLSFSALIGELLRHECKILRKEACWIISNVTAVANSSQMQGIIDLGLIDMLLKRVRIDEFDVKEVAACAISNVFYGCDDNQFECIKVEYFPLLDDLRLFFDDDPRMATMCSKILELDNTYLTELDNTYLTEILEPVSLPTKIEERLSTGACMTSGITANLASASAKNASKKITNKKKSKKGKKLSPASVSVNSMKSIEDLDSKEIVTRETVHSSEYLDSKLFSAASPEISVDPLEDVGRRKIIREYNVIKATTNVGSRSQQNKSEGEKKLSTVAISTDCSEDLDSMKPRKVRSGAPLSKGN